MRIRLPKIYKGTIFPKLFSIEMNDFAVEMLLPGLFFLFESKGYQRKERTDAEMIDEYIGQFKGDPRIEGFSDPDGSRILEKWVKTSLMVLGRKSRAKVGTQILYLQPLTYLTFKAGFPTQTSRIRNVNYFVYSLIARSLAKSGDRHTYDTIREALREAFAQGVDLPQGPPGKELNGHYDGHTSLDTETLLSALFMDVFKSAKLSNRLIGADSPICVDQAQRFQKAFVKFILIFKDRMPARELIYNLQALINFELCIYTLKLAYGTNQLSASGIIPPQFIESGRSVEPFLYADFTETSRGHSREMARQCVSRDLHELSTLFTSVMRLRLMDRFVESSPKYTHLLKLESPIDYLKALRDLKDDTFIQARAENVADEIMRLNTETKEGEEEELNPKLRDVLQRCSSMCPDNSFDRLAMLLDEAQRTSGARKYNIWFRDVGGIEKPYGFVRGSSKRRDTWAYSPSNDLIWALVHLASIRPDSRDVIEPKPIRLVEFLDFLEQHYGLLINRPVPGSESIEANRASRENLSSFQRRLRQMGLFESLSDDFEAQYILPQYRNILQRA